MKKFFDYITLPIATLVFIGFAMLSLRCTAEFDDDSDDGLDSEPYWYEDTESETGEGEETQSDIDSTDTKDEQDTGTEVVPVDSEDTESDPGGTDCVGSDCPPFSTVFPSDSDALAIFELNGDFKDTSGNGRHGTKIGGSFVDTEFGRGLEMNGDPQGFSWAYPKLIAHPYTIEMVLVPVDMSDYEKLLGFDDGDDPGWYYVGSGFEAFPNGQKGSGFKRNTRHYLAVVSTSTSKISVFLNGKSIGSTEASFSGSPKQMIFFRDDTDTGRSEFFKGVADAVRISSNSRSLSEIQQIQQRLDSQPYGK